MILDCGDDIFSESFFSEGLVRFFAEGRRSELRIWIFSRSICRSYWSTTCIMGDKISTRKRDFDEDLFIFWMSDRRAANVTVESCSYSG